MAEIPFHTPSIGEEEIEAVTRTLRTGWLTTGKLCLEFEDKFASYVGSPHAVTVNSCTAALHLILVGLGISKGDEVITSPYTFVATTETVLQTGAQPVFVDIQPATLNLDPDAVEAAVTPATRAIIAVHMAGYPCDMEKLLAIGRKHGIPVIDDAAHALPTLLDGKKIGSTADASAFSFYATKNLTTGEGGMVTTPDPELAEKIRVLRLHGIAGDSWKRYSKGGRWFYEVVENGYKYNLTDLQAALGLAQLAKLDALDARRCDLAARYREALSEMPVILQPPDNDRIKSAHHLFVLRLDPDRCPINRDQLIHGLQQKGIQTSVHFIPVHLHPFYKEMGYRRGMYPRAEAAYDQAVSLPLYPALADASVEFLLQETRTLLRNGKE